MGDSKMKIQVKLMGVLKEKTPVDGQLQLPESATVATALETLEITADNVQVLTINGSMMRNHGKALCEGDQLTVIPPVGGG